MSSVRVGLPATVGGSQTEAGPRTAPSGWRFLAQFALLSLSMGVVVGVTKIVTALHALALGAGPAQLGLITSGGMVGMLVMALPIGYMVDHFGARLLFVLGSVLAGSVFALQSLAHSAWFLLGTGSVIGFLMPLRFVSLNTVFFAQIRALGAGKASWSRATHMSGMFLIGPALGALLAHHLGFALTWVLVAVVYGLTGLLAVRVMDGPQRPPAPAPASAGAPAASATTGATATAPGPWCRRARALAHDVAGLLRDPMLRRINLVDFISQGATLYTTTFIVVLALRQFGLDAAQASGLVTAWGAAFIGLLFFGGALVEPLGERRCLWLGIAVVVAGLVALGSAGSRHGLWLGVVLQGLGAGLVQVININRIAHVGARLGQGRVSGLNLMVGPLGGLLGSGLGGWLGQRWGLQPVFFGFIPGYLLLAALQRAQSED